MKRALHLIMTVALVTVISIANAQNVQCYGYARTCFNGESWQNKFVAFNTGQPDEVQAVSETLPEIWAATYLDGYVWYVTMSRSLCKAPFDGETQTMGASETVVAQLEQYNLIIDMAYNPIDGMMYYLCQDSQYFSYLKRSSLDNPSAVETIGTFSERLWTLAINSQGQAFGVAYEGGNLYQINLTNATTTLVGPTGKDVWYTQSMAFDMDTDVLYWAQFATSNDHGLFQVNTETGAATALGEIGNGTQLTGLFMVQQPTPPEPEVIYEISVEGFTAPAWGEHPDYEVEVDPDSPYTLSTVEWHRYAGNYDDHILEPEEFFDLEDVNYYLFVVVTSKDGYVFDENPLVYFDGDNTVFDAGQLTYNDYRIYTIDFQVSDPTDVTEQFQGLLSVWPNPAHHVLNIEGAEGEMVTVCDAMGRLVLQQQYKDKLDVSSLVPGVYAVSVAGSTMRFVLK